MVIDQIIWRMPGRRAGFLVGTRDGVFAVGGLFKTLLFDFAATARWMFSPRRGLLEYVKGM